LGSQKPVIPHTLIPGAPILLVGEAPDRASTEAGRPFAGESGRQLDHFLKIAKINKTECSLANVFNISPPDNKLLNFCGPTWKGNPLPYLERGHYVQPPYLPHLDVLAESISLCSPNLIIGLGNTACWALLHKTGIGSLRGYVTKTFFGTKFLPTYHPGAVRNNPKLFPIVAEDFIKARRHSGPEQLSRPERTICVADTLREAQEFWNLHGGSRYSCDVETKNNEITCIGFAAKKTHALVVPFVDNTNPKNKRWWRTYEDELAAWRFVERILSEGTVIFHNGSYDTSYILLRHKIPIKAEIEDTMVMHHALEPELQKSLGTLGSIFTDEPAWKLMRLQVDYKKDDQ
jgi:uracil-DNA glycosylase